MGYEPLINNILAVLADPTYMIRAIPSNASDNVYCTLLAHSAIHGAMAGYSFTVGMVNGRHTYIPFYVSNNLLFIYGPYSVFVLS
jgi:6-phosphofructokinase